jgi:hypothetical protein
MESVEIGGPPSLEGRLMASASLFTHGSVKLRH